MATAHPQAGLRVAALVACTLFVLEDAAVVAVRGHARLAGNPALVVDALTAVAMVIYNTVRPATSSPDHRHRRSPAPSTSWSDAVPRSWRAAAACAAGS